MPDAGIGGHERAVAGGRAPQSQHGRVGSTRLGQRGHGVARLEGGERPRPHEFPVAQIEDVVSAFVQIRRDMGREEDARVLAVRRIHQDVEHFFAGGRVQPTRRLIEDEQQIGRAHV